jgi:hypothetical protein
MTKSFAYYPILLGSSPFLTPDTRLPPVSGFSQMAADLPSLPGPHLLVDVEVPYYPSPLCWAPRSPLLETLSISSPPPGTSGQPAKATGFLSLSTSYMLPLPHICWTSYTLSLLDTGSSAPPPQYFIHFDAANLFPVQPSLFSKPPTVTRGLSAAMSPAFPTRDPGSFVRSNTGRTPEVPWTSPRNQL